VVLSTTEGMIPDDAQNGACMCSCRKPRNCLLILVYTWYFPPSFASIQTQVPSIGTILEGPRLVNSLTSDRLHW